MRAKVSFLIVLVCLALLSIPVSAQSVKEYVLADEALPHFFDSRVLSAPTHPNAVVFFAYVEEMDPQRGIDKRYIKSLVVNKKGRPGPATTLAATRWTRASSEPADGKQLYEIPRMVDIIWNSHREGFDLYMTVTTLKNGRSKGEELRMIPLDDNGQKAGRVCRIRSYDKNGGSTDFHNSRRFISAPGGRRILLTQSREHDGTDTVITNVRLHSFDKRGKKLVVRNDVLGNSTSSALRSVRGLFNYGPDHFCIYYSYTDPATDQSYFGVQVFDALTLRKVDSPKSFTLQGEFRYAAFADNCHFLFFNSFESVDHAVVFRLFGNEGGPISANSTVSPGNAVAIQYNGIDTVFNLFTVKDRSNIDRIYLTRVDAQGHVLGRTKKLFRIDNIDKAPDQLNNYAITETANGNIVFVNNERLYVRLHK